MKIFKTFNEIYTHQDTIKEMLYIIMKDTLLSITEKNLYKLYTNDKHSRKVTIKV